MQKTTHMQKCLSTGSSFGEPGLGDTTSSAAGPQVGAGLFKLCKRMFKAKRSKGRCSSEAFNSFIKMYQFFYLRTSGQLPTDAAFLRACLSAHPEYRKDSVVFAGATYDICRLAMRIGGGEVEVPELLGPFARRNMQSSKDLLDVKMPRFLNGKISFTPSPEKLLHGKGRVAASLQSSDVHERLRACMLAHSIPRRQEGSQVDNGVLLNGTAH